MATTATKLSPPSLDLRTPATLPIRLGSSVLGSSDLFASVRYNHKPSLDVPAHSTAITSGETNETTHLSLPTKDGQAYRYAGSTASLSDAYVLLPRGREMLLERLSSLHVFNLVAVPGDQDNAALVDRYPQLTLGGEDEGPEDMGDEDLFGEDDGTEDEVDPNNPFDWRHWLNKAGEQEEQVEQEQKKVERTVERRVVAKVAPIKKRKQAPTKEKSNAKRVKAGEEGVPSRAKSQRSSKPSLPQIRLDRKASIRRSTIDVDDSGELILEDEELSQPAAKSSAMSLALSGHLGDGPISLRSAASSPTASRFASASPLHTHRQGVLRNHGDDIDLDPDGSTHDDDGYVDEQTSSHARQPITTYHFDDLDGDDDGNDEDNADVEDLELPSPAQVQRPSISAATVTAAPAVEDDDDLGEALALALGEDDDAAPPVHESDEESEEE